MKIKSLHIFSIFLIVIPIGILMYIFLKYAVNIPHWDDHALKSFQVNYNRSNSFFEKIQLIFAQHNEHRIALTRLFSLIIYKNKGTIDYRYLMILGNLSLIGTFSLLCLVLKKYKISIIYFTPISFLLFGLQLNENLFWGMASVQNFWVVFLAFLAFYLLLISENKYAFWWAVFATFVAINTSGNGILAPIIGTLILLYQRRNKELIYWLSISCVFIFLYFYDYQIPPDTSKTHATLTDLKNLPKGLMIYFGSMLDSMAILPQKREDLATVSGLFLSLFIVLFFRQTIFKKYNLEIKILDLFLLTCLLFIAGTALVVTYSRLGYGVGVLFGSKYKIYSTLFFIIFYIVAIKSLQEKSRKIFGILAIFGAILFNIYTYYADYQQVIFTRQERICDEFNWTYNEEANKEILKVYTPEKRFYEKNLGEILGKIDTTNKEKSNINILQDSTFIRIEGSSYNANYTKNKFLILRSNKNRYLFPFKRNFVILTGIYTIYPHLLEIPKTNIQTGKYQLGYLDTEHLETKDLFSSQLIDIQGLSHKETKKNW